MSKWLKCYGDRHGRRLSQPAVRLFCFPYAGGGPQVFAGWPARLPDGVELWSESAPGRGARFDEPPLASLPRRISELRHGMTPLLDRPCLFFGHSNGALVAFELARSLQQAGLSAPGRVIISAKRAPHLPPRRAPLHGLPTPELIERLESMGNTPPEILRDRELMDIFLPTLRADFALAETHDCALAPPLAAPVTLFHGDADTDIPLSDMRAWKVFLLHEPAVQRFPGGHFFLEECVEAVTDAIGDCIHQLRADYFSRCRLTAGQAS